MFVYISGITLQKCKFLYTEWTCVFSLPEPNHVCKPKLKYCIYKLLFVQSRDIAISGETKYIKIYNENSLPYLFSIYLLY